MSEPGWMRQPSLACEYCGAPGHLIALPIRVSVYAVSLDDPMTLDEPIRTAVTCPERRFLVQKRHARLDDGTYFERTHGRPPIDGPSEPELLRASLRSLIARLSESDDPEVQAKVGEIRRLAAERLGIEP